MQQPSHSVYGAWSRREPNPQQIKISRRHTHPHEQVEDTVAHHHDASRAQDG